MNRDREFQLRVLIGLKAHIINEDACAELICIVKFILVMVRACDLSDSIEISNL